MNYEEAIQVLIKSYTKGKKQSFDALRAALSAMGDPHKRLRCIHVAGTNGKGSVCAMLSSILMESGYSVGVFTSPHLHTFNERIAVNGQMVVDDEFAVHLSKAVDAMESVLPAGDGFSYFQLLTLAAFSFFAARNVDYAVLEAGIGGRLDSTNVIEECVLAVITSVGLDHVDVLGDTIEGIAREKGGIIKKNCPVVLYSCMDAVYNMICGIASAQNAFMYCDENAKMNVTDESPEGIIFDVQTRFFAHERLTMKLAGAYQPMNACTALLAVHALRERGLVLPEDAVRRGLENTRWPGRMEIMGRSPLIILDGAHNRDAAEMFMRSAKTYFAGKHVTAIIGVLRGKEYVTLANGLAQNAEAVIFTKPAYAARAMEPKTLYAALEDKNRLVMTESDYRRALDLARKVAPADGVIVCAGSLYLVGDIREVLRCEGPGGMTDA